VRDKRLFGAGEFVFVRGLGIGHGENGKATAQAMAK